MWRRPLLASDVPVLGLMPPDPRKTWIPLRFCNRIMRRLRDLSASSPSSCFDVKEDLCLVGPSPSESSVVGYVACSRI